MWVGCQAYTKYEIKIKLLNHFAGTKRIYWCLHVQFRFITFLSFFAVIGVRFHSFWASVFHTIPVKERDRLHNIYYTVSG